MLAAAYDGNTIQSATTSVQIVIIDKNKYLFIAILDLFRLRYSYVETHSRSFGWWKRNSPIFPPYCVIMCKSSYTNKPSFHSHTISILDINNAFGVWVNFHKSTRIAHTGWGRRLSTCVRPARAACIYKFQFEWIDVLLRIHCNCETAMEPDL